MSTRHFLLGAAAGGAAAAVATVFFVSIDPVAGAAVSDISTSRGAGTSPKGVAPSQSLDQGRLTQPPMVAQQHSTAPLRPSQTVEPPLPAVAASFVPGLSAEHAKLLLPSPQGREPVTVPELHARFSAELKDTAWAHEMEQVLAQFLSGPRTDTGFDLLSIECRKSMCEILAFGNLPGSQERWNAIGAEMTKQVWWSNFRGNATSSSDQNGRTVIATILQRARQ